MEDALNGCFELVGAVLTWGNVRRLYRDKETRGVFWPAWGFFAAWGLWNLYYYAHLAQWWSWTGGLALASANVVWVGMACYYALNPHCAMYARLDKAFADVGRCGDPASGFQVGLLMEERAAAPPASRPRRNPVTETRTPPEGRRQGEDSSGV